MGPGDVRGDAVSLPEPDVAIGELPQGKRLIGCKWVYSRKEGPSEQGGIRFKARLVAKGYSQKESIDFSKVFSSVVRHTSIKLSWETERCIFSRIRNKPVFGPNHQLTN